MAGGGIPRRALDLLERGRARKRAGDLAGAVPLYETSLDVVGQATGERGVPFAQALGNLGLLLAELGAYDRAEPLLERARAVMIEAPEAGAGDRATVVNNLAGYWQQIGRDDQAAPLFAEALALEEQSGGVHTEGYGLVLNNLALSLQNLGRFDEAEPLARRALEVRQLSLGPAHPEVGLSLNNLGLLYERTGRYREADRMYRDSIAVQRGSYGDAHPYVVTSRTNLARLHQRMGRGADAETLFRQALEGAVRSLGEVHPVTAAIAGNLGMLYHDAGRWEEARALFEAEVEIAEALTGVNGTILARALNHLGLVRLRIGEHAAAAALFERALARARSESPQDQLLIATILNNAALVHLESGRHAQAEELLREVLGLRRDLQGDRHPEYEQGLFNLATALVPLGRVQESLRLLEQAAALDDELIAQVFGISADSERLALLDMLRQRFELYLSVVLQHCADDGAALRAAFDLVLRRKGLAVEVAAAQRTAVLTGRYPELADRLRELDALGQSMVRMAMSGPGPEGAHAHGVQLERLRAQATRLEADLSSKIGDRLPQTILRQTRVEAVAAALPPGTALVELLRIALVNFAARPAQGEPQRMPAEYVAFVVRAGVRDVAAIRLGAAEDVDGLVAAARAAMLDEGDSAAAVLDQAMRQLRRAVFDPLAPALEPSRDVVVCPDGDLTTWPFEVLPSEAGHPLVVEYAFRYLSVARDVLRLGRQAGNAAGPPVVVAAPDYDLVAPTAAPAAAGPAGGAAREVAIHEGVGLPASHSAGAAEGLFDPLPGTQVEGARVAAMLGTTPLLGGAAREGTVKRQRAPRVLHVATHGFFVEEAALRAEGAGDRTTTAGRAIARRLRDSARDLSALDNPLLRSGLALAGANTWLTGGTPPDDAEDGLLTAADVSGMDLNGTQLVVLSACQTGLGQVHVGEGVFGLRRAFMLAGAETLVLTLWEVPDAETVQLMDRFYARVLAGAPVAAALRAAQLEVRQTSPHPAAWGAFICLGEGAPIVR